MHKLSTTSPHGTPHGTAGPGLGGVGVHRVAAQLGKEGHKSEIGSSVHPSPSGLGLAPQPGRQQQEEAMAKAKCVSRWPVACTWLCRLVGVSQLGPSAQRAASCSWA